MTEPLIAPTAPTIAQPNQGLGLALAAIGAALFATKGIFVKLALAEGLDAISILTWRMLLSVPVFAGVGIIAYLGRRAGKGAHGGEPVLLRPVILACLVGILGYYGASLFDFLGLVHISAQLNRLILLTYPFFVLVFGAILFRRRLSAPMMGAAGLAYAGIAVIFTRDLVIQGDSVLLGTMLVLGSAVAYALYQLFAKPLIDQLGARIFTSIAMTAAGVVVFAHFLLTHGVESLAVSMPTLGLLAALAIFATVLPAFLIATAIGLAGSERTAIFGNISPLVTIVLAVWVLGETFTLWHGIGTALVICGILLFTSLTRRKIVEGAPLVEGTKS